MATVGASGTLGALTIGVETNIEAAVTPAADTTFIYYVDLGAAAAGETFILRLYMTLLAAGAERKVEEVSWIAGSDDDPAQFSLPVTTNVSIRVTIQQKNGVGRAVPWVRQEF